MRIEVIDKFVKANDALQSSIDANDTSEARKNYKELLVAYNEINASEIENIHKEIAHEQIVKAYHSVSGLKGKRSNTKYVVLGALVILVSIVFLVSPGIIGFTLFETDLANYPPKWIGPKEFHISGATAYNVDNYFLDNDLLTFLASSNDGLGVSVNQNIITFMPFKEGKYSATIVASDGDRTTKVRITVVAD